jgi:hypothetical protein
MSATFITDNIDRLSARPLGGDGGWEITFRSGNDGLCHQLYVNGRLADWTDTAEQRSFLLKTADAPCEIVIAAIDRDRRGQDMSEAHADSLARPGWVCVAYVPRTSRLGTYDRLALLGDHATGQIDPLPLVIRDAWPGWTERWPWGRGPFGLESPGMGGLRMPGLGMGAFGAGEFGMDADLVRLEVSLRQRGLHRLLIRTIAPDGGCADTEEFTFTATPPPQPPANLMATAYDPETDALTLEWEPSEDDEGS